MDGVELIMPANEAEWHAARSRDITASIAGAVLGCHSYTTAFQVWAEKSGRIEPDREENEAMRRGRLLEPAAIEMLREERPNWSVDYRNDRAYYRRPDLRIGATPDAFAVRGDKDGRGIVQIKVVSEDAFRNGWIDPDTRTVELPLWIAVQAITEARLTDSQWAAVAAMVVGRGIKMHVVDIPLHDDLWSLLVAEVAKFWAIVDGNGHPPIQWEKDASAVSAVYRHSTARTVDLSYMTELDAIIARFEKTREERRALELTEHVLRPQILHALGDAEAGETDLHVIRAPTTYRADGATQRTIRIQKKEHVYADF
jgi:predicted phage-related endonuclease